MRLLPTLLVLSLVAAGCVSDAEDATPAATSGPEVTIDAARPEPTFSELSLAPAGRDLNATLDAAPVWVPGEWWRYHFMSPLTGEEVEFVRVVASVEGDTYVVGMPHEAWYKEAIIYHTPCFGDIAAVDLGCAAHNVPFQPLKFPLTDATTWVTQFERPPDLTASVKVISPTEAEIIFTDPDGNVQVEQIYDASIHEVRSFKQATAVYEIIEHGYGFEGWITIPRAMRLVFEHGRLGTPLVGFVGGTSPATPTEAVEIVGGFNRLSFILATGNIGIAPAEAGYYKETATAPDGTVYEMESAGLDGLKIEFLEAKDPDGVWELQHVAAGPGIAFIEGVAYHQYDILLPGGAIRSDHSHDVIR